MTDRVSLALIARDAACSVDGVVQVTGDPPDRVVTAGRGIVVAGVLVTAHAGGGFAVAVHLVAEPVDLHDLGDRVRDALLRALPLDEIASVDVRIHDVEVPS